MSGLLGDLLSNTRALTVHAANIQVAGSNIANVNNPDYSRQRVDVSNGLVITTALGAQSTGIVADGVKQIRDDLLDNRVTREITIEGSLRAWSDSTNWIEDALGQRIDTDKSPSLPQGNDDLDTTDSSLTGALDNFFNAFHSLSAKPDDPVQASVTYDRAADLTEKFNLVDSRLERLDEDLVTFIEADVNTANQLLSDISRLNQQIDRLELTSQGQAPELRDQRQKYIEQLAGILNFQRVEAGGTGKQWSLIARDNNDNEMVLTSGSTVQGKLSFENGSVVFGENKTEMEITGGSIQGYMKSRNQTLSELRSGLDDLATQMTVSVNTLYNPTGATGNFFDAATNSAGTFGLDSSLSATNIKASNEVQSGANDIAIAIAELQDNTFRTTNGDQIDGNPSDFLINTITNVGRDVAESMAFLENQELITNSLKDRRQSLSGVSLDEEVSDLMRFQKAYQGSARVVSIINDLLDLVVNRLG